MGGVYPQLASVDFTDSMIDPVTGTVSMRAIVHNGGGMLLPGQFVRVYLKGLTAKGRLRGAGRRHHAGPRRERSSTPSATTARPPSRR
ncbi:MAG: hypothetical protein WDN72_07865 [Alphaproteobacteria bacterium]